MAEPFSVSCERSAHLILVVDDDSITRKIIRSALLLAGYEVQTAADGAHAIELAASVSPDLIVSDVMMPNVSGLELIRTLREQARDLPVILVSSSEDRATRLEGFELGADDYVEKPIDPLELVARVAVQLRRADQRKALRESSLIDELTGLYNRRGYQMCMSRELRMSERAGESVGLFLIDLDRFKMVNDTHGHHVGDEVLRDVAREVSCVIRARDTMCRIGGDEFVIVFPNSTAETLRPIALRVRAVVARTSERLDIEISVGASIGQTVRMHIGQSAEAMLQLADAAMYADKRERRAEHSLSSCVPAVG